MTSKSSAFAWTLVFALTLVGLNALGQEIEEHPVDSVDSDQVLIDEGDFSPVENVSETVDTLPRFCVFGYKGAFVFSRLWVTNSIFDQRGTCKSGAKFRYAGTVSYNGLVYLRYKKVLDRYYIYISSKPVIGSTYHRMYDRMSGEPNLRYLQLAKRLK